MTMETIEGSKTSAFKIQTPGKYPKENILHKEHGESLKSEIFSSLFNPFGHDLQVLFHFLIYILPCYWNHYIIIWHLTTERNHTWE